MISPTGRLTLSWGLGDPKEKTGSSGQQGAAEVHAHTLDQAARPRKGGSHQNSSEAGWRGRPLPRSWSLVFCVTSPLGRRGAPQPRPTPIAGVRRSAAGKRGVGMRPISGFSAFTPGSESSLSISSVFPGRDGGWGRTTTTGGKGGAPQPRGGQRRWNGPQLLPPARTVHASSPSARHGDRPEHRTPAHHPSSWPLGKGGQETVAREMAGLSQSPGVTRQATECVQRGNAALWWPKRVLTAWPHLLSRL